MAIVVAGHPACAGCVVPESANGHGRLKLHFTDEEPELPRLVSRVPPALPQGSELLRDPSLGAQFRVHLVKMVLLTRPEVGAKRGARSPRKPRFRFRSLYLSPSLSGSVA